MIGARATTFDNSSTQRRKQGWNSSFWLSGGRLLWRPLMTVEVFPALAYVPLILE